MEHYLDRSEFLTISRRLEEIHSLFVELWSYGTPCFSLTTPSACVEFNKNGKLISFKVNPEFWKTLNQDQKIFVIAHECYHIALGHGLRFKDNNPQKAMLANYAMDLVVNIRVVESLNIPRKVIDPENVYCWVDTVFSKEEIQEYSISETWSFEQYFSLLLKLYPIEENNSGGGCGGSKDGGSGCRSTPSGNLVDEHNQDYTEKDIEKVLKGIVEESSSSVVDEMLSEGAPAGPEISYILQRILDPMKRERKKKWETVIREWARKSLKYTEKEEESWTRKARRFQSLDSGDLMLPSDLDTEVLSKEKNRISVWFFLDTSGSCCGLGPRFWRAALSLPEDRFELKMFCFDTRVYETSLESRELYGFGGTTFTCINNHVNHTTRYSKYPDAIFVLTDGYGDRVYPPEKYRNRWYWFLTEDYKHCIPPECNIFRLRDFE